MIVLVPIKLALIYFGRGIGLGLGLRLGLDWIEFDFVCARQRAISMATN